MYTQKLKLLFIFTLIITVTLTLGSCDLNDEEPTMYDLTVEMEGEGVIYEDGEKLLTEEEESETLEVEENTSVTLEAEPEDDWKFIKWTGDEEDEEKEISVPMDEDKSVTAHFEEKTAHFEVDITDYTDDITGEGEDIEIDYEIENTGDVEDTKDIIFSVNGEVEDSEEITLAADETYENEFIYTTKSEDVGKELDIEVASDDDADAASITVLEPEEAYFEVDIDENESCDEVSLEEELTIVAEINNTGDISDAQKVEMTFQEEIVDTKDITLDGGEDTTEEFTHEVSVEAELGYTDASIKSEDDNDEHEVYVTEFARGRGTEDNPYLIETAEQLDKARDYLSSHFKQIDDIDLSEYNNWEPIGDNHEKFSGEFNGNNFEILNLNIDDNEANFCGLFGYTSENSLLKNMNIVDVFIAGNVYVAGLIGRNDGGIIKKSEVSGTIKGEGNNVGGIVGYSEDGVIEDSHVNIEVSGTENYVGGLVGRITDGSIIESSTTGKVEGEGYGTGGLVGYNLYGEINNCYSKSDVSSKYRSTGGLIGFNSGDVENCYTKGTIEAVEDDLGGLIGHNSGISDIKSSYSKADVIGEDDDVGGLIGTNSGYINECYSINSVESEGYNIGGLVGNNSGDIDKSYSQSNVFGNYNVGGLTGFNEGDIVDNYALGKTSGTSRVGGITGLNDGYIANSYAADKVEGEDNIGGIRGRNIDGMSVNSVHDEETTGTDYGNGRTTEEMTQENTFTVILWNFGSTWEIIELESYPYFQWQDDNIPYPPE